VTDNTVLNGLSRARTKGEPEYPATWGIR